MKNEAKKYGRLLLNYGAGVPRSASFYLCLVSKSWRRRNESVENPA